jgi:hypothetical protein
MSARIDDAGPLVAPPLEGGGIAAPGTVGFDSDDRFGGHALPNDHPKWMRDTLSLSGRARSLLIRLRPVVVRVVAAWEHRVRSLAIGTGRLSVDASGSYRLD